MMINKRWLPHILLILLVVALGLTTTATLARPANRASAYQVQATAQATSAITDSTQVSTPAATDVATATPTALPPTGNGFVGIRVVNSPDGVRVVDVLAGSPADNVGIKPGDIIVSIDDRHIEIAAQVQDAVSRKNSGDMLHIQLRRANSSIDVAIRLGQQPSTAATPGAVVTDVMVTSPAATFTALAATNAASGTNASSVGSSPGLLFTAAGFRALIEPAGFRVAEIRAGSPAAQTGLRSGDLIVRVDQTSFNYQNVLDIIQPMLFNPRMVLNVNRDGQQIAMTLVTAGAVLRPTPLIPPTPLPVIPPTTARIRLGVTYEIVTTGFAASHNLTVQEGAYLTEIVPNSPAALAGLKVDDVVTALDGDKIDAKRTLLFRLAPYNPGDSFTLTVVRGGETIQVQVVLTATGRATNTNG